MFASMRFSTAALGLLLLVVTADPAGARQPAVELRQGDRVVFVGNTLAERMQLFNHFETLLMTRFAGLDLVVRNLGWSADTIRLQPRPLGFGAEPTHLYRQKAGVIFAFFGANESFDGEPGLAQFERDLDGYLRGHQAASYDGTSPPRIVLVSPVAHERLGRLPRVDVEGRNRELARYTEVMRRVARARGVAFVDLFTPTSEAWKAGDTGYTINGIHLSEKGDRLVAGLLMNALGFADGLRPASAGERRELEELRAAIRDKNQQHFYRYRPVNTEYVMGRRVEPFGSVNFPKEMERLDEIVAERERRIWERARKLQGVGFPASGAAQAPAGSAEGER